jgi:hypothetical protein
MTRPSFQIMQNFLFGPGHMLNLPDLVNSIISTIIFEAQPIALTVDYVLEFL